MNELSISRKSWLAELLIGVFGVKHVKLLDEENGNLYPIIFEKGWFQNVKCTAKYLDNYAHLFKRALLYSDTIFYNDIYKQKKNVDRDLIIANAKRYFGSYGYSEEKYKVKYSTNDMGRLFYKIIINKILPVIFEIGCDINDDITDRYNKQKEKICSLFSPLLFDEIVYIDARNQDIDKIMDYGLMGDESKADIAIPMNTSGDSNLGLLISWKKMQAEIITKPADSDFIPWSERTDLSLDELMEKWIKYPFKPEDQFDKPWDPSWDGYFEKNEQLQYCPITRTEIKRFNVLSRYIFFVTNSCFFEKCTSYDEMMFVIKERLKATISDEHDTDLYIYYKSISDEIREMVSIVESVDIKLLIEHDQENYKNIVKHFNLDPDVLFTSCSFYRNDEAEILDAIYNILEKAIYDFAIQIDEKCSSLVKEFKNRINITQLINVIEKYINDDIVTESISILDDRLIENRDKYYPKRKETTGSSMLDKYNTFIYREENYLQYLRNVFQKFYDCLNTNESQNQFNNKEEIIDSDDAHKKNFLKENIDQKIELLKEPIKVYLKTQYTMLRFINGEDVQFTMSDYNEYDKLRMELLEYQNFYISSLNYYIFNMDKKLKEWINSSAVMNDDIFNTIIESNLSDYKRMLYSEFGIKDEEFN